MVKNKALGEDSHNVMDWPSTEESKQTQGQLIREAEYRIIWRQTTDHNTSWSPTFNIEKI